jgi:hypothetical protein
MEDEERMKRDGMTSSGRILKLKRILEQPREGILWSGGRQRKRITEDGNEEIAEAKMRGGDEEVRGRGIERGGRKLPIKLINCVRKPQCEGGLQKKASLVYGKAILKASV